MKRLAVRIAEVLLAVAIPAAGAPLAPIVIDYPAAGSIFPPDITPPTFLWRDSARGVARWRIDISFAGAYPRMRALSRGPRLKIGPIDPECVSETNEPPKLNAQQAQARTWSPSPSVWETIKKRSVEQPATIAITGLDPAGRAVSSARISIRTSKDPVGAPVFYRDVPLMPTETKTGRIQPLAADAVRLIRWRLRDIGQPRSRVVMEGLPVCANCHSFSLDGKTMGMDLDGLQNNKGIYTLSKVAPDLAIRNGNLIQWSLPNGRLKNSIRVGFMSQVSPDGRYVITTIDQPDPGGVPRPEHRSNYYVVNFKDYKFLQVFFPTRGLLAWYSRETGVLTPLPGADDPRFVSMGAFWSPDGKYLVFMRAAAKEPNPEGAPPAKFANDPNENQIQYDLYRIPFNGGKGGAAEPVVGASANGMSNTFPKVSPDGRWIVYVRCRNGQLMRPDSQLYIVPAAGGEARRMRCNTPLMNSWHSFSPNGRWLAFSSKSRSPYTRMFLTHIDEDGNDSPAILVDNTAASNRAVNLPEFVNIPPDGLREIGGPAIDYYRLVDRATYFQKRGRWEEAAARWTQAIALRPDDVMVHNNLGTALLRLGRRAGAAEQFQQATEIKLKKAIDGDRSYAPAYESFGRFLLEQKRAPEAIANFEKAVSLQPDSAGARTNLGLAFIAGGRPDEALVHLRRALEIQPRHAPAYYGMGLIAQDPEEAIRDLERALELRPEYAEAHAKLGSALYARGSVPEALAHWREAIRLQPNDAATLGNAAWVLATSAGPSQRNGPEAVAFAVRALRLSDGKDPAALDALAAAYAETGRYADAALTARRALALAPAAQAASIKARIVLYESGQAFRAPAGGAHR